MSLLPSVNTTSETAVGMAFLAKTVDTLTQEYVDVFCWVEMIPERVAPEVSTVMTIIPKCAILLSKAKPALIAGVISPMSPDSVKLETLNILITNKMGQ